MWIESLGCTGKKQHCIVLQNATTKDHQPAYRAVPATCKYIRQEIAKMLEYSFIDPTDTKWSSQVVLALKKYVTLQD